MEEKLLKQIAHLFDENGKVLINIDHKPKKNYFYAEVNVSTKDNSLPTFLQNKVGGKIYDMRIKKRHIVWKWRLREEELLMQFLQSIRPYLIKQKTETEILIEFLQYKNKRLWDCPSYIKSLERIKSKKESWIGINKPDFSGPFLP